MTVESLEKALSDERVGTLANTLQTEQIPTPEAFEKAVEQDLKDTLDPSLKDGPVNYKIIRDKHGDLVGWTKQEQNSLPWWLQEFKWTVDAKGADELELDNANKLDRFEKYPEGDTRVVDISLQSDHHFKEVLAALIDLRQELQEQLPQEVLDQDSGDSIDEFPKNSIFDRSPKENRLETKGEFRDWLEDILSLFPPDNTATTGILMASTGVGVDQADEVLTETTFPKLDRVGLNNDGEVLNRTYVEALETLMSFASVFDRHVEVTQPEDFDVKTHQHENEGMEPLKWAFFQSWAKETDPIDGAAEWFGRVGDYKINQVELLDFANIAFETPLWHIDNRICFQPWSSNSQFENQLQDHLKRNNHPVDE